MNTISIQYYFRLANDKKESFELKLDAKSLDLINTKPETPPPWTALEFHQCANCTLNKDTHSNCPLSMNLVNIVNRFDKILSYDKIFMEVITDERKISQHTTAQRGLSSLMGLIFATGGCPHTVFFKPMARFHLPLASEEETIFRATSTYLLAQYFLKREQNKTDFDMKNLKQIYHNMELVNIGIVERLRAATEADSSANALILLDVYAKIVPYVIEGSLEEFRYLFSPFLNGVS